MTIVVDLNYVNKEIAKKNVLPNYNSKFQTYLLLPTRRPNFILKYKGK